MSPWRRRLRWLASIRLRAFVALALVLGVLAWMLRAGERAFERFARLQSAQELVSEQSARVQEIELRLLRCVTGAEPRDALEAALVPFGATLDVLCRGGAVEIGGRRVECPAPDDAETTRRLHEIRDSWTIQRARIGAAADAGARRAQGCRELQHASAPFLAELAALGTALEQARETDAAALVAEARQWAGRMQSAAAQLESLAGGDGARQASLALTLGVEKVRVRLSALRDGSEDLEIDALADEGRRERLARAEEAFAPFARAAVDAAEGAAALETELGAVTERCASLRALQSALWAHNGARTAGELSRLQSLQLYALLAVAGMIVALGAYLHRALLRPILRLRDLVARMAQGDGDLTQSLSIARQDEIGELAARFDEFLAKLRELVRETASSVEALGQSSDRVAEIAARMSEGVRVTESRALEVIEGVQAIDRDFSAVVEGATHLERGTSDIRTSCLQTSEEVERSVASSATVRGEIDELARAAGGISEVVAAIHEISLRVKLLSLNAAIEAARAGEAGRGFAVVATEVRTLAHQTQERTGRIDATIRGLVEVCERSSRSFQVVDGSIARIQERQVAACRAADGQLEASTNMRRSLASTHAISTDVRASAGDLREHVSSAAAAAQSTRAAADELASVASHLRAVISQFRY